MRRIILSTGHCSPFTSLGYTLIEILVGLVVVGLLFAVGYIGYRGFSRRQVVVSAVRALRKDLRLAQGQVLAGKKPTECSGTLSSYNFRVVGASEYVIESICGEESFLIKDVFLSSDLSMATPSINPIVFKSVAQGTNIPLGAVVTITITQKETANTGSVLVGPGGDIR